MAVYAHILTVLLAGGRSSRMGGQNKALLKWQQTTLIGHLQDKLAPLGQAIISANHDLALLERYGLPLVQDEDQSYAGPLAGLLAAMNWAKIHQPNTEYLAVCSCDTPFIPKNLYQLLIQAGQEAKEEAKVIFPRSHGHIHPLHGLWSVELRDALAVYLRNDGRRVQQFSQSFSPLLVPFDTITVSDGTQLDPFTNINNPQDYQRFKMISER